MLELNLAPHLDLMGNLDAERWPEYVDFRLYETLLGSIIQSRGLELKPLVSVTVAENPVTQFLIGKPGSSRKIAVHENDPRGVIYILEHNDTNNRHDYEPNCTQAVTLGALLEQNFAQLELNRHENDWLSEQNTP